MDKNMKNVCYIEIAADNPERAQKFYSELLGWKFKKAENTPMDYWMVDPASVASTSECSPVGWGMMKKSFPQQPGMLNYILVSSLSDYTKKVQNLGGSIQMERQEVPGYGAFAICKDTEGTVFALWENTAQ